jgi:hypothetical protein
MGNTTLALTVILGEEGVWWIPLIADGEEWSSPDYSHQN